jgi:catechol 2,3-dioxygenase-like lactoylglutathione lyase family enzyme
MHIQNAQLWVHDQNEALDFYVGKLGWEVRSDVTMPELGGFRWLTVGPVGQDDFSVVLMAVPGPPIMDSDTAEQVRSLMAKGFAGTVFLTTDDVDRDYSRLSLADVEFTSAPTDMPYGRDCGLRDPSGNQLRLAQLSPEFAEA